MVNTDCTPFSFSEKELSKKVSWSLLNSISAGLFVWDRKENSVRWSDKVFDGLGYDRNLHSDFYNNDFSSSDGNPSLIHPDDRDRQLKVFSESAITLEPYEITLRMRRPDGAYEQKSLRGFWFDPEGLEQEEKLFGYLSNITNDQKLEERLKRVDALFQQFFDNCPAGVFIKNSNFQYVYGNPMAADQVGCSLEEFIGASADDLYDSETATALIRADKNVLETQQPLLATYEISVRGRTRYITATKFSIIDPITGETFIGGFGIDITAQRQAEKIATESQRMESLGRLVAGIAHDFNNIMAVLMTNLELLEDRAIPADARELVREMNQSVDTAKSLTTQLLSYSSRATLKAKPIDTAALLERTYLMLKRTVKESITISLKAEEGLWVTIADEAQLESALLNIVINARDAMPKGGQINIAASNLVVEATKSALPEEVLHPGHYVVLTITDTGTGMTRKVLQHALDPYFTTKQSGKGTGLGLSMIWGFMRQIGGDLIIKSKLGEGTTIELHLPATMKREAKARISTPVVLHFGEEHILLVEDESLVRKAMTMQLEALGYRVTSATNGSEGLSLFQSDASIDLVLTDIVMPGPLQGPDMAIQIRNTKSDARIIYLSGYPLEVAMQENGLNSEDKLLMKPVKRNELSQALRETLEKG